MDVETELVAASPLFFNCEEVSSGAPWYYEFEQRFANTFGNHLSCQFDRPGDVASVEELFTKAKDAVRKHWSDAMMEHLDEFRIRIDQRAANVNMSHPMVESAAFRKMTDTPTCNWLLEDVAQKTNPELWHAWLLALSQKNVAEMNVARSWIDAMSDEEVKPFGYHKSTLLLFLDLQMAIQSDVDHLYIRELEHESTPGGKEKSSYIGIDGAEYVHYRREKGKFIPTPFREVHPQISLLAETFRRFSKRVREELVENVPEMRGLDAFMNKFADALDSSEIRFSRLENTWKNLAKDVAQLAKQNCPILINPSNWPGENGQVAHDFMIGLNTGKTRYAKDGEIVRRHALRHATVHHEQKEILPIVHQLQFWGNGSSQKWISSGYSGDGYFLIIDNESDKLALRVYRTYHDILFNAINEEEYVYARGIALMAHELGHKGPETQRKVIAHLGRGMVIDKLDEFRGDHKGMKHIFDALRSSDLNVTADALVQQYILEYFENIALGYGSTIDEDYTWYAFTGTVMIERFFRSGAIRWRGSQIEVVDPMKGIEIMASLGRRVDRIFRSYAVKERHARAFVQWLEYRVYTHADTQKFIRLVCERTGIDNPNLNRTLLEAN